jgi:tripartite-type tricarboxylate transporter receptor subunit TctC
MKKRLFLKAALMTVTAATVARAQSYPSRPVRLLVGFSPGGTIDVVARIMGDHLAKGLGQPFVVENRVGANGMIAADAVARSRPDGQTLFVSNSSTITLVTSLVANPSYDPVRSFRPIASVLTVPLILCVNATDAKMADVKSFADLIAMTKSRPGGLTYGSAGNGNITHLGFELLSKAAGVQLLHVPYNGAAAAQLALLSGDVSVVMDTMSAVPQIRAGKMRPLAVTSLSRLPELPDVPTVAESGHPGFDVTFWVGFFASAGTSDEVAHALEQRLTAAAADPAVREQLRSQGVPEVIAGDAFAKKIAMETEMLSAVAKQAGIRPQ